MKKKYPRDLVGYGSKKVKVKWPGNAKLALQFVLNYEEGAENCTLHGDKTSEVFLSEIIGAKPIKGRHLNMESIYEYGSRRGFWRIHDLFNKKKIPLTIPGIKIEGQGGDDWLLVDAGDVIIHLMSSEAREFYDLESLWDPEL